MNKCLVTSLKGRTGNMNLPVYNGLQFEVKSFNTGDFFIGGSEAISLEIVRGDGHLYKTDGTLIGNVVSGTKITCRYFSPTSTNGLLLLKGKYALTSIADDKGMLAEINSNELSHSKLWIMRLVNQKEFNLSLIDNWPNLQKFSINGAKAYGDISVFAKNTLNSIKFMWAHSNEKIVGNIESLAVCVNAVDIHITTINVYGKYEELLSGMFKNGRTSGTMNNFFSGGCTFNNIPMRSSDNYIATFSSSGVSVSLNDSVVATYDGSTWSYT